MNDDLMNYDDPMNKNTITKWEYVGFTMLFVFALIGAAWFFATVFGFIAGTYRSYQDQKTEVAAMHRQLRRIESVLTNCQLAKIEGEFWIDADGKLVPFPCKDK